MGDIPEYKKRGRIKGERETANYGLDIIRREMYYNVQKGGAVAAEIITVSEARKNFLKIVKELEKIRNHYIVTRGGRPSAVLMNYDEYFSLMATLDILSDKELMTGVARGLTEKREGNLFPFEDVLGEPY
ncbi:MAG: type II toxin-antitoxin system prevent-host-death family antitoxin [Desulfobacterales bacterium]|nr:type II toxin-antitoxin system prevent-host-death family antitoxin [Desulfobacterales bacterium]